MHSGIVPKILTQMSSSLNVEIICFLNLVICIVFGYIKIRTIVVYSQHLLCMCHGMDLVTVGNIMWQAVRQLRQQSTGPVSKGLSIGPSHLMTFDSPCEAVCAFLVSLRHVAINIYLRTSWMKFKFVGGGCHDTDLVTIGEIICLAAGQLGRALPCK